MPLMHGRRSGWNSEWDARRAPATAEGGSVPNGVGYGEECPFSSRLGGLGSDDAPPAGSGQSPSRKRILVYFEGHRTLLFVSI